jgi:hypothetical protein
MGKNRTAIAVLIALILFLAINDVLIFQHKLHVSGEGFWAGIGLMVAAGLTLAMYSFLYKDNPVFKLVEHLYVGVSVGYIIIRTIYDNLLPNLINPLFIPEAGKSPDLFLIIPAFFGVLMLSRFIPKYAWVSRWSIAFIVGWGSGMAIPRVLKTFIFEQAKSTMDPLSATAMFSIKGGFWGTLTAWSPILVIVGVICVLMHFLFSLEHKGVVRSISKVGIGFLMIAFGAGFGYTVMGRMSLLIGRVTFLLKDWLHVID